jgi:hypothetical protein
MVHLNLGVTTVDKALAALSDQTGLTIRAAEYLQERTLTIYVDNISAAAVLEALDTLNDWIWSTTQPNHVLVTRRRLRFEAIPTAVTSSMQAAIPRDIRTYLRIATPSEDTSKYVNAFEGSFPHNKRAAFDRLMKTIIADQTHLVTSLQPGILTGEPIAYTRLTSAQRSDLLVALVFPLLRDMDYEMLHGDALPHVSDVKDALLQYSGATTLLIGSEINDGKTSSGTGFGAQIR